MIVSIGSRSQAKVSAICRAFARYPELWMDQSAQIRFIIPSEKVRPANFTGGQTDSFSKVSLNPVTLGEIIAGAKNRALESFDFAQQKAGACTYGVGIEAGIFPVDEVKTGYLDTSACAIYNGKEYFLGCSPLFEYPREVVGRVLKGEEVGLIKDYFHEAGKGREGAIGVLTSGRICRDDFEEYAVLMALTQIVNKQLFL